MSHWLNRTHVGDCRALMAQMAADGVRVQTCVTSPPYFGLRDYGHDGQIGLESSPVEYVAAMVDVFRAVRDVLADDGTVWLNLGDSYGAVGGNTYAGFNERWSGTGGAGSKQDATLAGVTSRDLNTGLKPKNLLGIPWRVAFALQQPYYTGRIKDERDRVWLAAMVDAEGSICGTEYETGDRTKTNLYISVTNTSTAIIDKCERLFPQDVKHVYEKTNGASSRKCYRWDVERIDNKALFLREIYPYLVAKRKQAIIGYTFLEMQRGLPSKKKGYLPEQHEQRSWLMDALSRLNAGENVDLPEWTIEPPSLFEPGYYLRQDVIWSKPNPMPESVRDRCTKAHEYVFLLAKSERYYFDSEAMQEPATKAPGSNGNFGNKNAAARGVDELTGNMRPGVEYRTKETRNRRSVWTVTTSPFSGAHFATFPPELIQPCILAGAPAGGVVLDPFMGSGTTGQVATDLGRQFIGCELNPAYIELHDMRRTTIGMPL